ncbi:MAG: ribonuclease J [Solirubrobacteraceae bacterium]|nr:ribonuclease J [Solirubrobacteraceae bacterium]
MSGPVRVLPLGGLGEIGKNMTVVEQDGHIIVIDVGLRFPTQEQHGVDLVLPDFTYLIDRAEQIDAVVITHGHEDHLGALPFFLRQITPHRPKIYGRPLTMEMGRSKLDEHRIKDASLNRLDPGNKVKAGPFEIELIHMTHSIPDASGVVVHTEYGPIFFTGDYKFDQTPVDGGPADLGRLAELGKKGITLLCGDSTNADRPGWSLSEAIVGPKLNERFAACKGRILVTCFASNIHRVQQVIDAAALHNRKVCLIGRSMRKNTAIGRTLGHINIPEGMLVTPRDLEHLPDERIVIISTGSQGEPLSALRRMAYGDHQQVSLHSGDTVIFSATPIPGNEKAVGEVIDAVSRRGATVVTTKDAPIHASGHGYQEELKLMLNLTRPRYVMPFHGDFTRIRLHSKLAQAVGIPEKNVFECDNGDVVEITAKGARLGKPERAGVFFVDGMEIGDVADVALRDRRMLSADGICVVVATITEGSGESVADPEVLLRGVPAEEEHDLIETLRDAVDDSLERAAKQGIKNPDRLEEFLHDDLAGVVYAKLKRRPMVLPVVVEV